MSAPGSNYALEYLGTLPASRPDNLTDGCNHDQTRNRCQYDTRARRLRATPVRVACEAQEPTLQRLCEDQVAAHIATLAGKPTLNTQLTPGQDLAVGTDPYLAVARRIGAGAIVRTTLGSSAMVAGPAGPTIGIGVGGGSGGRAAAGPAASAASRSRSAEPLSANAYSIEPVLIDPASGGDHVVDRRQHSGVAGRHLADR